MLGNGRAVMPKQNLFFHGSHRKVFNLSSGRLNKNNGTSSCLEIVVSF
jgi:hypothetical protein